MANRLTTVEFIKRARAKHGDRYDYSKTKYVNQKTRVVIGCPVHGDFLQLPTEHYYKGSKCRQCANAETGKNQRLTTEGFIKLAREKHRYKYDYSKVVYVTQKRKVIITCPDHGDFLQAPTSHYNKGAGCPECAKIQRGLSGRVTQEAFIESVTRYFPDYDFSGSKYSTAKELVEFSCPSHGMVEQYAHHLNSGTVGCPKCGNESAGEKLRLTSATFLERALELHGGIYDYFLTSYFDMHTPVSIICPKHGEFSQLSRAHLQGSGCPECGDTEGADKRKKSIDEFLADAKRVHGDRYDYSESICVGVKKPISIRCKLHGLFSSTPDGHINGGTGCPICFPGGFNTSLPGTLYYLRVDDRSFGPLYKIGITNKHDPLHRWQSGEDRGRIKVLKTWFFDIGETALRQEQEILIMYSAFKYEGPNILSSGNTEMFNRDVLRLDHEMS